MRFSTTLLAAGVAGLLSGCGAGCNSDIPVEDVCSSPRAGAVEGVAMGKGLPAIFTPLVDDDVVNLVLGTQGASMLPVRFRMTGADVPACVDQRTTVTVFPPDGGSYVGAQSVAPLNTYAEEDEEGVRETGAHYLIINAGEQPEGTRLEVRAEVAGFELAARLWTGAPGALPDGATIDAAPAPIDAAVPDAAPPDAAPPDAAPPPP